MRLALEACPATSPRSKPPSTALPVSRRQRPARQQADRHRAGRCFASGRAVQQVHVEWALATGSTLEVGNDPVYVKTRCFETFPFPDDLRRHRPAPNCAERIARWPSRSTPTARRGRPSTRRSPSPACTTCWRSCAAARADRQGEGAARPGPGRRAAEPARRAGRRRAGRLRLVRPRPGALGRRHRPRRLDRDAAGTPGGAQHPPRRRGRAVRPGARCAGCARTSRIHSSAAGRQPP
jgi:hypothetical protein